MTGSDHRLRAQHRKDALLADGSAHPDDLRRATLAHLGDIERVHGPAKRWQTLHICEGRLQHIVPDGYRQSLNGSAAALCAAEGDIDATPSPASFRHP